MKKEYLDNLTQYLSDKKPYEIKAFLEAILTPQELESIPMRLEIIHQLKKGISQREITKNLEVGIATVTRGSHELKKGNFSDI
jgi:TrpR family transcriptional regulator, trp operon repressor